MQKKTYNVLVGSQQHGHDLSASRLCRRTTRKAIFMQIPRPPMLAARSLLCPLSFSFSRRRVSDSIRFWLCAPLENRLYLFADSRNEYSFKFSASSRVVMCLLEKKEKRRVPLVGFTNVEFVVQVLSTILPKLSPREQSMS